METMSFTHAHIPTDPNLKAQFAHQFYQVGPAMEYSNTSQGFMPSMKRSLPQVPTLPSTPGISRPGSAGSNTGFVGRDEYSCSSWAPATPMSGNWGSPVSAGRPCDPMVSGFEAEELNAAVAVLTPVTPGKFSI